MLNVRRLAFFEQDPITLEQSMAVLRSGTATAVM
jgi:hypothetical protein